MYAIHLVCVKYNDLINVEKYVWHMWNIFLVFSLFWFYNSCKVWLNFFSKFISKSLSQIDKNLLQKKKGDVEQFCVLICDK
jgi:hypothetical protein